MQVFSIPADKAQDGRARMDLSELFQVLWRRKVIVVLVTAIVIGIAFGALRYITPLYESTSTVALRPENPNDIQFLITLEQTVPVYATAANSRVTRTRATRRLAGDFAEKISVRTFGPNPVMKIKARDPDAQVARRSAQAVTDIVIARVRSGEVGIPALDLIQIDRPQAEASPVFPRYGVTLAVAALLGIAFGVAAALLRENLTSKVETPEALANLAGAPCFAEIPNEPVVARVSSPEELTTNPRLRALSEALRDLRTNLLFSEGSFGSVVVTSPEGSHGKTTIAFGLAATLARSGSRTLLVDGDLRKGRVAEMLDMSREFGLNDVLRGTPPEGIVQRTSMDSLDVLTGGHLEEDPGELLTTEFSAVLSRLKQLYEVVVIDTTPLVPVNDARIMASFADTTVIVANAASVTRRQIRMAVERLSLISVRPTAVVLNGSRSKQGAGYYGYLAAPVAELSPGRRARRRATRVARR
jgi:capsular exopolysaccharide synthesis family protein